MNSYFARFFLGVLIVASGGGALAADSLDPMLVIQSSTLDLQLKRSQLLAVYALVAVTPAIDFDHLCFCEIG